MLQYKMNLYQIIENIKRELNNHTEKCTVCGLDVEYLEHMRVQHQINQPFSTAWGIYGVGFRTWRRR
jgi:hypothetical protein